MLFKYTIVFIILSIIGVGAQARLLEDIVATSVSKKEVKEETLQDKVKDGFNDIKKTFNTWVRKLKPKSAEELATEKRVQAEINRQKRVQEQLQERTEALPDYKSQEKGNFKSYVDSTVEKVGSADPLVEVSRGISSDPSLPKTKVGVPYFTVGKIEALPKLNVGLEPTISSKNFDLDNFLLGLDKYKMAKPLRGPEKVSMREIERWTSKKIISITEEKKLQRKDFDIREVVTEEKIQKLTINPVVTVDDYKPYKKFTKRELKMIAALILNRKGDKCHLVVGLFDDLSKHKKYQKEADYHLGVCSIEMGFHSESVKRLLPLVKMEDKEYAQKSLAALAKQLPREFEVLFYDTIRGLKAPDLIAYSKNSEVAYLAAKGAYKKGHYGAAIRYAELVKLDSKLFPSSQFILATSYYLQKNAKLAVQIYQNLEKLLENSSDENLKTLVAINLARISFQSDQYKKALEYYRTVKKNHPLWVQGLIEQGWAQIMIGDYPGAIGNMYSLHSPYFKSVYMPDSWAVRTIGYLNICQYGDAYSSLTKLENQYGQWLKNVDGYVKKNKLSKDYYYTVTNYLKGKSDQDQSGLPYQVIREMARQREYLNYQDSINLKVDELAQYDFIKGLIDKDIVGMNWRISKAKTRIEKLSGDIAKAQQDKSMMKNLTEWKQQLGFERDLIKKLNFQLAAYKQGQKSFKNLNNYANKRISKEIYSLREKAGGSLVGSLKNIQIEIAKVLENNEFLRYEVFAGSGENIRYQVAGGEARQGRVIASTPPPKSLKWEFEGEYWEDEIGSYRSTLKNNCPDARASASINGGK